MRYTGDIGNPYEELARRNVELSLHVGHTLRYIDHVLTVEAIEHWRNKAVCRFPNGERYELPLIGHAGSLTTTERDAWVGIEIGKVEGSEQEVAS